MRLENGALRGRELSVRNKSKTSAQLCKEVVRACSNSVALDDLLSRAISIVCQR
ncbi:hypothetical protein SVAN01_09923 [Stagonosporopsis vannaccii]|nr:hypothetical protein SVAN01_09923 [Stagonosporopsis vannaccii]